MSDLRYHGGNINAARALFPNAPDPWIDLSTGINPVPYPIGIIPDAAWTRLPEADALADLEAAARDAYGAGPSAEIVAAPGTQALIQVLPRVTDLTDVAILNFTYSEHERSWRAAGAKVTIVNALSDLARFQVGVVVNPNNPDGTLYSPAQLAEVAVVLEQRSGLLIVDEAFMDVVADGSSVTGLISKLNTISLRSFGKSYGLAGLRLGFALTNVTLGAKLRDALGPWAVSGPAIDVGRRALRDTAWLRDSAARLRVECERLDAMLASAGFDLLGGSALFRLARSRSAPDWFRILCQHGILVRPFATKPDQLRFGIPHQEAHWARLQACLSAAKW